MMKITGKLGTGVQGSMPDLRNNSLRVSGFGLTAR